MIPRSLDDIRATDLERLRADNESEGLTLEFKRELDRKERVLATVCAFANTATGDLIIGAEEEDHYLKALPGVAQAEVEGIKTRVEQWVRSNLEPPSVSARCRAVELDDGQWAIVVRVERSWAGPHRVKDGARFYRRHSTGNCEMTIDELRRAFTEQELLASTVRKFRDQRVALIQRTITPVRVEAGPRAILHLLPFAAFRPGFQVDVHEAHHRLRDLPLGSRAIDSTRYNLEGVVGTRGGTERPSIGYLQVFRTGALEAVFHLNTMDRDKLPDPAPLTAGIVMPPERVIAPVVPAYLNLLDHLGVPWPVYALVSVARVKDYQLWRAEGNLGYASGNPLAHEFLTLPEVDLPRDASEAVRALRPVFDVFWQAFEQSRSIHFDDNDDFLAHPV